MNELDGFDVAKGAAEFVLAFYSNQQTQLQYAKTLSEILDRKNRSFILAVKELVRAELSEAKLTACVDMSRALCVFVGDLVNAPNDLEKIHTIDIEAGKALEVLKGGDICVPGITTFITVASMRILALQRKSLLEPGNLINAKNAAASAAQQIRLIMPAVHVAIDARLSKPAVSPSYSSGVIKIPCCQRQWHFVVDGNDNFSSPYLSQSCNHPSEESAKNAREQLFLQFASPPIYRLGVAANNLEQFARARPGYAQVSVDADELARGSDL